MKNKLLVFLSYVLVAALSAGLALTFFGGSGTVPVGSSSIPKLEQLKSLLEERFIGEVDETAMEDAAAAAMVDSLGDRWSGYLSAEDYKSYMEQMANAYVGIGVTISTVDVTEGFTIIKVEKGSPAEEAGIVAGDMIVGVEGESVVELGANEASSRIKGEEGTQVLLTIRRDGEQKDISVFRRRIQVQVASYQMLDGNIGLVSIENFDSRCADETLAAVKQLLRDGAVALIFDVRNNPGGYKNELVKILDYLLPEGPLFRSLSYTGQEYVDQSDADHLDIPMAVLVNSQSYSAAEFFAAALSEYDAAVVVGQNTTGKGYYQNTLTLCDGSAVTLSVGKYFTPNGVSLADAGGLVPDVVVEVDEQMFNAIYADTVAAEDDPQIQAAVAALLQEN